VSTSSDLSTYSYILSPDKIWTLATFVRLRILSSTLLRRHHRQNQAYPIHPSQHQLPATDRSCEFRRKKHTFQSIPEGVSSVVGITSKSHGAKAKAHFRHHLAILSSRRNLYHQHSQTSQPHFNTSIRRSAMYDSGH